MDLFVDEMQTNNL